MTRHFARRAGATASVLVAASLLFSACSTAPTPSTSSNAETSGSAPATTSQIVIDTTFDIKTIDPGRAYEPTGEMVLKALYDTLVTFADNDTTTVVPDLATYTANDNNTEFTFTLADGRVFSDGSPVTADDVVFTLTRFQGLKGNGSFLLDGVTISKVDDKTVKLTTASPSPALPAILATPSIGILNSKVVQANGGTTDEKDGAETFLNGTSAGSGPYTLESLDLSSQAVLVKNQAYNGAQKPTYEKVILRNVEAATQKLNVERGESQLALNLSGDQVTSLAEGVELASGPSATVVFLLLNADPSVNELTAKPQFVKAVKEAIDYQGLLEIAGGGAAQATSLVPSVFLGSLPADQALTFDLDAAKADAAAAGATGTTVKLQFPNDIDPTGVNLTTLAERLQSQLAAAGITVELAPAPFATEIDPYRTGKEEIGLWYWNPDYLDPANYLAFGPGQSVGLRAGWTEQANPAIAELVAKGYTTADHDARKALFEQWGKAMNEESPFIPLVQPGFNLAYQPTVTNVSYNPSWLVNVAGLGAA